MAQIDISKSRFTNYSPACVKCKHFKPNALFDPFDTESKCALFGDIPIEYILMDKACDMLDVEPDKAFIDVGDRPLTMLERWAIDDEELGAIADAKEQ